MFSRTDPRLCARVDNKQKRRSPLLEMLSMPNGMAWRVTRGGLRLRFFAHTPSCCFIVWPPHRISFLRFTDNIFGIILSYRWAPPREKCLPFRTHLAYVGASCPPTHKKTEAFSCFYFVLPSTKPIFTAPAPIFCARPEMPNTHELNCILWAW